jgi:bifunctional DNA-binding transcriptional regulator/antitoxin component of YhaV-PrlF toxin-antitoxin module
MSSKFITTVQQDAHTEDCYIEIPSHILKTLNWQEGDELAWSISQGKIILTKVKDAGSTKEEPTMSDYDYYSSESVDTTGGRTVLVNVRAHHDDLVILATSLNDELVGALAILEISNTLLTHFAQDLNVASLIGSEELLATDALFNVVLLQCFTQHLGPQEDVLSDALTGISRSSEFSEGGHVVCLNCVQYKVKWTVVVQLVDSP